MGKITWMLLVPLVPSVLLFVVFPDATFSFFGARETPKISASGAVGLYFALIVMSIRFLKADRLDAKMELRAKILGEWSLVARWKDQKGISQETTGDLQFTLDAHTQRLVLNGWAGSRGERRHFASSKVFVDDNKLTYLVDTASPDVGHRRWLVEIDLPATKKFTDLHGVYHEVEGDGNGTVSLTHNAKGMALAPILTVASIPTALATFALLWISGWLSHVR